MSRYSERLLDHSHHPRNEQPLPNPDGVGMASQGGQNPHIIFYVYCDGDRIRAARFQSAGCGIAKASASVLTELVQDRTRAECRQLTSQDVISALDGLPPTKRICAELAIFALRNALDECDQSHVR